MDFVVREQMGRMIHCVGECRLYRGMQFIRGKRRSLIREGDEIETARDSYAWVLFWDGSLLRVSPESGVTFREFNVAPEGFFLFLRLNRGHLFLANRNLNPVEELERELVETDALFSSPGPTSAQWRQLQRELTQNSWPFRPTWTLLSMTNGGIYGRGLEMELFHQIGGVSFFRQREVRAGDGPTAEFWYRGYHRREDSRISPGRVYRVDSTGRQLGDGPELFFAKSGQLLRRIPSILTIREQWLRKYARALHGPKGVAVPGFRLWEQREMRQRISFLRVHERRVETAYGYRVHRHLKKHPPNRPFAEKELPRKYFQYALKWYVMNLDRLRERE